MAGLHIPLPGLMISAAEAVQCILEAGIVPCQSLIKHTAAATFKEAAALGSGVSIAPVMVR